MRSDIVNVDQAESWNGYAGDVWAQNDSAHNRGLKWFTPALMEAAAISSAERILDIGCGAGETSRLAARLAPAGHVLGLDLSAQMLARAVQRAAEESLANLRFQQGDAQTYPFEPACFDVAISRLGAMFFSNPEAGFANIRSALSGSGRLAILAWQSMERNEWMYSLRETLAMGRELPVPVPNAPGPHGLSDPEHVRTVLARAGFFDMRLDPVDSAFFAGADAEEAYAFVERREAVQSLLRDLDESTRSAALSNLRRLLEAHETADGVIFQAAAWVIVARASR